MAVSEPSFARSAIAADRTEPDEAKKDAGYVAGEPIPYQEFNGLLGARMLNYPEPSFAYDMMPDGTVALCGGVDLATARGAEVQTVDTGEDRVFATGRYVVVESGSDIVIFDPATLDSSTSRTISPGASGTVGCVDGRYVYWSDGTDVKAYNLQTGTLVWTKTLTYTPRCSDGALVYCLDGDNVRALDSDNGNTVYTYDHGATVVDLVTDGERLWLCGGASSAGSGARMRCIEANTGKDDAGEGGIGTSTMTWTWDAVPANYVASVAGSMAFDGDYLYVIGLATGTHELFRINAYSGAVAQSLAGSNYTRCAADLHYWYTLNEGDDVVEFRSKEDISQVLWTLDYSSWTSRDWFDTDGFRLFFVGDPTGSGQRLVKIGGLTGRLVKYKKRDPATERFATWSGLAMQPLY